MSHDALAGMLPESLWDAVRREAAVLDGAPASARRASLERLVSRFAAKGNEGRYLETPALTAAYLLAFLPYEVGKIELPLRAGADRVRRLARRGFLRLVDGGAGPGSATLGLLAWLAREGLAPRVAVQVCDQVAGVRAVARRLIAAAASGLGMDVELSESSGLLPASGTADVVVIQNALSEACRAAGDAVAVATRALGLLRDGDGLVMVVEPADAGRAWFLSAVRDGLLAAGVAQVLAPCTRTGPCPLSPATGRWCHVEIPVALPRAARLGLREGRLPRTHHKLAYLVLAAGPPPPEDPGRWRLVGPVRRRRGVVEAPLCGPAGIVTAHGRSSSDAARRLARARWGDGLAVAPVVLAGDRLELLAGVALAVQDGRPAGGGGEGEGTERR